MAVKLIPSQGYIHDRAKILDSIIDHSLRTDSDAVPILRFFRYEERELHRKIKLSPLSAGINFPRSVKKRLHDLGATPSSTRVYQWTPPRTPQSPE